MEESQDQCKCENLIMFQNLANEEVRKLTQRHILFLWDALCAMQAVATLQVTVGFNSTASNSEPGKGFLLKAAW